MPLRLFYSTELRIMVDVVLCPDTTVQVKAHVRVRWFCEAEMIISS